MDDISDSTIFGEKSPAPRTPVEGEKAAGVHEPNAAGVQFTGWGNLAEGRFEPRQLLGRGGFAAVYRAFDRKLNREVALKIPHYRFDQARQSRQWLLREGKATAALKHPNIVTLYDFEVTEDSGYLVNELVEGSTLAEFIDQCPSGCNIRQAVEIVAVIAEALEHAHVNGVLHRDLKPSNILLDGKQPIGSLPFSPRLSDFGLASLPSQETLTRPTDSLIGSIQFIPPEVIDKPGERFTKQGDIYSLSCVLYELLTGSRAFTGSTYAEIIKKILQNDFASIRKLRPEIPKDLAAICYQGMTGTPSKRYASASLLAQDLRSFLRGDRILARKPSWIEQIRRVIQRHPAVTTACLLVSAALVSIVSLVLNNNRQLSSINETLVATNTSLEQALEREAQERLQNERIIYSQDMMAAGEDLQRRDLRSVSSILSRYNDGSPMADHRDVEWNLLKQRISMPTDVIWQSPAALYVGCYSSNGEWFATAGKDAMITILDVRNGRVVKQWESGQLEVNAVVFSGDDQCIWTTGDDGTVRAWNVQTGEQLWQLHAFSDGAKAFDLVFLPQSDGLIVSSEDNRLQALSATTGERRGDLENCGDLHFCLSALPSQNQFFSCDSHGVVRCFDGESLELHKSIQLPQNPAFGPSFVIHCLDISPDGRYAVLGQRGGRLILIDLQRWSICDELILPDSAESLLLIAGESSTLSEATYELIAVSPEAIFTRISISEQQQMSIADWWVTNGEIVRNIYKSPFLEQVMVVTAKGEVQRLDLNSRQGVLSSVPNKISEAFQRHSWLYYPLHTGHRETDCQRDYAVIVTRPDYIECIRSDNQILRIAIESITANHIPINAGEAGLWIVESSRMARYLPRELLRSELSNAELDQPMVDLAWAEYPLPFPADELNSNWESRHLFVSPNGKRIAGYDRASQNVWICSLHKPEECRQFFAREVTLLQSEADGDRWWWNDEYDLVCWSPADCAEPFIFARFNRFPERIAVSSDRSLVAVTSDRHCSVWDIARQQPLGSEFIHESSLAEVSFSPSGKTLMTFEVDGTLNCWNLSTGRNSMRIRIHFIQPAIVMGRFFCDGGVLGVAHPDNQWKIERLVP